MSVYVSIFIFITIWEFCLPLAAGPLLLVISLDGFRYDYIGPNLTPNMMKFREDGVYAEYMDNVKPTFTFVNHWTAATGRYPGEHGVLANKLYDRKFGRQLTYSEELFSYNPDIIPIFTLNQMNEKHTGVMMWPGGEFAYTDKKIKATFVQPLAPIPWNQRIDTIISWFTHATTPTNFVMMYLNEPDDHAHSYSPISDQETEMIRKVDNYVAYIEGKVKDAGLSDRLNIVYVSDHGMESVLPVNFIDVTKVLTKDTYDIYESSPVLQIIPKPGFETEVLTKLETMASQNGNFKVYTQSTIPREWNMMNADRFGPILVIAEPGYAFQDEIGLADWVDKTEGKPINLYSRYGIHGYPQCEKMRAIFMAKGPQFQKGIVSPVFSNVNLYQLFCRVLNIKCIQTSGLDRSDVWNVILNDQD